LPSQLPAKSRAIWQCGEDKLRYEWSDTMAKPSQEQEERKLQDDELDMVSGGLVATAHYYAGFQSSTFSPAYWSPILLPPSPC
jgi:hypothetical protein